MSHLYSFEVLNSLDIMQTSLPGVLESIPRCSVMRVDSFWRRTRRQNTSLGVADSFVQDNHSRSVKGTLRGLHYQLRHPQAKLCFVVEGEALDVAVDIRVGSPHFGKWTSVLLSAEKHNQIYIPRGFAHGSLALTDTVQFFYKCSDFHDPKDEYGIH